MQEDLEDPEKELGQEGKKALKRDAETLGTSRKPNKSKLEKSLEMLCDSFKEATEMEMQQQQKKKKRHKREMEIQLKLRQLEMERRREERQHELSVLHLLPRQAPMAAFLVSQNFSQSYRNDGFIFRNNAGCSLLAYATEIKVVVVLISRSFTEHGKQCR